MEITEIKVKKRDKIGKQFAKKYRRSNLIPGVVYGAHLKENIHILVEKKDLWSLIKKGHAKEQHLLRLIIENGENTITENAILQDLQIDPIKDEFLHVDFHAITLEELVDVYVPILLVGEAKGIKQGGILQHGVEEILIRALPLDVPPHIEVDITDLEIGESITVGDLKFPENIKVLTPLDEVVVGIIPPKGYTEEVTTGEAQTESQT
ncbi:MULTISPECIES: 50S ribosomal protein L25/general stress protein Ctc [Dictyoglomus]|jgi:large subunit ribosomal protein L25|uniref:Large ribosomal subunit protein bL25 n=1 Tax=Dictyoglomus turgidum (strain DSM 6724 / Z-1310) TaxID=515635 RepID=RL25_DICTD|nr:MULTISPECIES: 50S ribosomal protein L25/general stress protein Ctc [Dictyoglomus]B8DZY2.1 RecName: Full=Large ribosomal subunit protein bL25; AltName: Full=50S ribosomal protein L25; AltName: Full=General stress protein CTC [Dictyoglomus turgidum DSM 6724]ACK42065.1 ribosomal 5S rRNA E-loop binding protein Ctc/L25/TL5 [Dictyoglomus turgidum DSM 6724]HBU32296.1 50S ribosomal protein L25 [Dictyoglomus sp.]